MFCISPIYLPFSLHSLSLCSTRGGPFFVFAMTLTKPVDAEVACADAIRQARVTRLPSKGLRKLARVNLKRSEAGTHHVFKQFGQSLDIPISKTNLPSKKDFPHVTFTNWLRYIVESDNLQYLCGAPEVADMRRILSTFWDRFEKLYPHHVICGRNDPGFSREMCIPVLYHGDEGRSLKKKQLMVLSTHGVLGRGSNPSNKNLNDMDDPNGPLRLNMIGNTFLTHFLQCVMPIKLYNTSPESFYHMLDLQGKEFAELFQTGVVINGVRFYVRCVGVKGDAPFLAKSGLFFRNFLRRPTRPSSRTPCVGVCHLCCAGREEFDYPVPFEEYGCLSPIWLQTVGLVRPYTDPSPLLQIPYEVGGTTEALWKFDLFHNFHSGMGKYFASSAIVVCLELVNASIDGAFDLISQDFKNYCRVHRECPYHKSITKTLLGVEGSFQDVPDGGWSKGDFTRLILKWFADYCSRCVIGETEDQLYLKCVSYLWLVFFSFEGERLSIWT